MISLLADSCIEGPFETLVDFLLTGDWTEFWDDSGLRIETFESIGIERNASDAELWRICQLEQVVLITSNRSDEHPDSLERTIKNENRPGPLPVFMLASPDRIGSDRAYAEQTALALLEYLSRIDRIRGTGRMYLP